MKTSDLIIAGLIGFGVYLLLAKTLVATPDGKVRQVLPGEAKKIAEYDGWTYYSDGTVISPSGDYYFEGKLVWAPAAKVYT